MKIATFNINNINRRLPNLLAWLRAAKPDVVCLQELKAADTEFPAAAIEEAGYGAVWRGQKTWNGVAILARGTRAGADPQQLPGDPADTQSRYIEAAVNGVLVASSMRRTATRSPGRNSTTSSPGTSGSRRMPRSSRHRPAGGAGRRLQRRADRRDIYPTNSYDEDALLQPESRAAFPSCSTQGWTDAIRTLHPDEPIYTFWDYMRNRWPRDAGLRLDHLLLSADRAKRLDRRRRRPRRARRRTAPATTRRPG